MGITPNTLQPRVTSALAYVGSVLGLERLDITASVTPANVKVGLMADIAGWTVHPPFPAAQG